MSKHTKHHFYSHLISLDPFIVALEDLDMSEHERAHLITIIESNLHYTIVDVVLAKLSTEDKKIFLRHMAKGDNEKTWEFLNERVPGVNIEIIQAVEALKKELLNDVSEVKTKKD